MRARTLALTVLLALPGCAPTAEQPVAVTTTEARRINAAATMLDANSVDADSLNSSSKDR